jgi:hypothetical protein
MRASRSARRAGLPIGAGGLRHRRRLLDRFGHADILGEMATARIIRIG